ncbi:hypothetical protein ACXOS7_02240 [Streptococcus thermophilus]|nr:hypothetical protein [Streptococcus thermophilus]MCE2208226.1 hypothetical protein [Streptococcus thermophilus]
MKRKKYNKKVIIMTFVLMTIFSFLTILSKHSKEPVKPETKTHHSSSFQSSKKCSSHKKTTTNSSTATSTDDKTRNSKEKDKNQASSPSQQSSQKQNGNTPPHQEGSQEEPNPFEGGRGWGGPEDGSYVTNSDGERVQSSSFNEINEWSTNADNSTYEYPQSSSSANSSLTVN